MVSCNSWHSRLKSKKLVRSRKRLQAAARKKCQRRHRELLEFSRKFWPRSSVRPAHLKRGWGPRDLVHPKSMLPPVHAVLLLQLQSLLWTWTWTKKRWLSWKNGWFKGLMWRSRESRRWKGLQVPWTPRSLLWKQKGKNRKLQPNKFSSQASSTERQVQLTGIYWKARTDAMKQGKSVEESKEIGKAASQKMSADIDSGLVKEG